MGEKEKKKEKNVGMPTRTGRQRQARGGFETCAKVALARDQPEKNGISETVVIKKGKKGRKMAGIGGGETDGSKRRAQATASEGERK